MHTMSNNPVFRIALLAAVLLGLAAVPAGAKGARRGGRLAAVGAAVPDRKLLGQASRRVGIGAAGTA